MPKSTSGASALPWPPNATSLAAGRLGAGRLPPGDPPMVMCAPAIVARRTWRRTSPPSTYMPSLTAATPDSPWWCYAAAATAGTAPTVLPPAAAAADPRGTPPVASLLLAVTEVARWCEGFKNRLWPAIF